MLKERLDAIFQEWPQLRYGYLHTDGSKFDQLYGTALVFAVPYRDQISLENYSKDAMAQERSACNQIIEIITGKIRQLLEEQQISCYVPVVRRNEENDFVVEFPLKYAAARAGLGWIGKNDLLITREYGPQVRLAGILMDAALPAADVPVTTGCPPDCNRCVTICPAKCLSGKAWETHQTVDDRINYRSCTQYLPPNTGGKKKGPCGLCMIVCPFGKQSV